MPQEVGGLGRTATVERCVTVTYEGDKHQNNQMIVSLLQSLKSMDLPSIHAAIPESHKQEI